MMKVELGRYAWPYSVKDREYNGGEKETDGAEGEIGEKHADICGRRRSQRVGRRSRENGIFNVTLPHYE